MEEKEEMEIDLDTKDTIINTGESIWVVISGKDSWGINSARRSKWNNKWD